MPRTVQDILDHADELASRFEDYTPDEQDERDPETLNALREAVLSRSTAARSIKTAVDNARADTPGVSFSNVVLLASATA